MNFKEKNKQINKEAKISIGIYLLFFVWWFVFAYGLGLRDVSEYTYVLGFPAWFFYSCIVGYILISIVIAIVVKKVFKEIEFDDEKLEAMEKTEKESILRGEE